MLVNAAAKIIFFVDIAKLHYSDEKCLYLQPAKHLNKIIVEKFFKKYIFWMTLLLIQFSCGVKPTDTVSVDCEPMLWPDYNGVTIPKNIAPLNFSTARFDSLQGIEASIKTADGKVYDFDGDNYIDIPISTWREIVQKSAGGKMEVTVSEIFSNKKFVYRPTNIYVADSEVDPYLCYRLIAPGYEIYSHIGLYCRDLTTFEQKTVVDNKLLNGNCINCHSFCKGDPDIAQFHVRGDLGGTVLKSGDNLTACNAKTDQLKLNCVYPYWHPSGNYIAYSQNNTVQSFHCGSANRVEVYDSESRVVVYDARNNKLLTCPELNSARTFTTEPSFSPDGKYLYYTTADTVDMAMKTRETHYDICRIGFDEKTGSFVGNVDTLVNVSKDSLSTAFPRPSYDGKWLLFTKCDYGQFAIWHKEAELWLLNLATGETFPLERANGPDADSYHSWSQNSEWIAFESRRDDGFYTRAYIAHINPNGHADKAFLIPQKSPEDNIKLMYSYNVPEFATKEFKVDKGVLEGKLKSGERTQFGY